MTYQNSELMPLLSQKASVDEPRIILLNKLSIWLDCTQPSIGFFSDSVVEMVNTYETILNELKQKKLKMDDLFTPLSKKSSHLLNALLIKLNRGYLIQSEEKMALLFQIFSHSYNREKMLDKELVSSLQKLIDAQIESYQTNSSKQDFMDLRKSLGTKGYDSDEESDESEMDLETYETHDTQFSMSKIFALTMTGMCMMISALSLWTRSSSSQLDVPTMGLVAVASAGGTMASSGLLMILSRCKLAPTQLGYNDIDEQNEETDDYSTVYRA